MSNVAEDIRYYFETFLDRLNKQANRWRYLSWETKVKVKGVLSVLVLWLAYTAYSKSWESFSNADKIALALLAVAALGIFATTLLEVLGSKHV